MTRMEAAKQGLEEYFTGKECKRGHVSARNTLTGACKECVKTAQQRDKQRIKSLILAAQEAKEW